MQGRDSAVDMMRWFGAALVVFVHVTDPFVGSMQFAGGFWWYIFTYLNIISRCAVPLFILLAGYMSHSLDQVAANKRVHSLARLFVWIPLYWLGFALVQPWRQSNSPLDVIVSILHGDYLHLYFITILWGIYVLLSIAPFRDFAFTRTPRDVLVWLMSNQLVLWLIMWSGYTSFYNALTQAYFFLPFFLLGRILRNIDPKKIPIGVIIGAAAVCIFALAMGLWSHGMNVFTYFHQAGTIYMILAVIVWWSFKYCADRINAPYIARIGRSAVVIYLLHPLVIAILDRWFAWDIQHIQVIPLFLFGKYILVLGTSVTCVLLYQYIVSSHAIRTLLPKHS